MTISSQTTIQAYQLKAGGTPARLAILRMIAADSVNNANPHTRLTVGDWKAARRYTMGTYAAAYTSRPFAGSNKNDPVYYVFGEYFREEQCSHDILDHLAHTGWFTDCEGRDKAVGIVARLPHARFIAGYTWTANDERVWFPKVFTDETDAARMADAHAESFANSCREDDERFQAMQLAEFDVEEKTTAVQESIALRHIAKFGGRDRVRNQIKKLREAREELARVTREYEGA